MDTEIPSEAGCAGSGYDGVVSYGRKSDELEKAGSYCSGW